MTARYFVHTRANGFKRWVCVERHETKGAAEASIHRLKSQDDPLWAVAEYLIAETLHPLPTQEGNA